MRRFQLAFPLLLFTSALTLFIIVWGGIVKSSGSSLGCPDWPTCYGQLIPDTSYLTPEEARQLFWEYGHRVIGALIGLCCIVAAALLWRPHPARRSLRGPALALLGLVVFQGLLGGLTVLHAEDHGRTSPLISTFHLGFSMIILLTAVWLTGEVGRRRSDLPVSAGWPSAPARAALGWSVAALLAIYGQILIGAVVRHTGAGFAAGFGPRASVLGVDPQTGVLIAFSSDPFVMLNLAHRYIAVAVAVLIVLAAVKTWLRLGEASSGSRKQLIWLPTLAVLFQILVGTGMIAMRFPLFMRTLHLAVAALALVAQLLVVLALHRAAGAGTETGAVATPAAAAPKIS
jgi:heme A synthase